MPNIAITNYCNLQCPYCFADNFIQTDKNNIDLNELNKILSFLEKNPKKITRIGVIGGEPTLHPNFSQILKKIIIFSKENHIQKPTVFSNGILLNQYSFFFADDAALLLNLNSPKVIGETNWNKIEKTLKNLEYCQAFNNNNVTIGINLYQGMPEQDYAFDICKNYNQTELRCSIVAPTCQMKTDNKFEYYNQNKELFINFLLKAKKQKITIRMDCNKIPLCYFSEIEKQLILEQTKNYNSFCYPVIDISHDMQCISCFGIDNPVNMNDFNDLEHLERYFLLRQINNLIENNKTYNCKNCKEIETLACQGGCLSFAK